MEKIDNIPYIESAVIYNISMKIVSDCKFTFLNHLVIY